MDHQVFISYRHPDAEVANQILTILEAKGITCWIDREISVSEGWDDRIGQAITQSRAIILVVTPGSQESPRQQKREISIAEKYGIPVVPLFVVPPRQCSAFDYLLGNTQYLDVSQPPLVEQLLRASAEIRKLLHQIQLQQMMKSIPAMDTSTSAGQPTGAALPVKAETGRAVAILYKRGAQPDEALLSLISNHLVDRGHRVFCDRDLQVGEQWRRAIREKVENADFVIPLLSILSVGSEMLEEELSIARNAQSATGKKPRILPVRVAYEGPLPSVMNEALRGSHYCLWKEDADTIGLLRALTEAIERPTPAPLTVARQVESPTGAVPLESPYYLVRASDAAFQRGIDYQDSILLVKGARQMGKTSLIARALAHARKEGKRAIVTDLQTLNESDFDSLESFYRAIGNSIADQLEIDSSLDEVWNSAKAPNTNFERFIRKNVLASSNEPLVWAIDEADRLFPRSYGTEVFGLFRSWHNIRQLQPAAGWSRLSLVIGYATEASLFIKDLNMSPFNVGTRVDLNDFSPDDVAELNARYGHPIPNEDGIQNLMAQVGGQPFLVRRSLYAITVEGISLDNLLSSASKDNGIFGDHLRRFYVSLHRDPDLETAVKDFILKKRPLDHDSFQRLHSAGLVTGGSRQEAAIRCGIYADYLREHLA